MSKHPHDLGDLMLAPVLLSLEERLEELAALSGKELALQVALDSNLDLEAASSRAKGLLEAIGANIDLHGWNIDLVERGLEVRHGANRFVLGLPGNLREFTTG